MVDQVRSNRRWSCRSELTSWGAVSTGCSSFTGLLMELGPCRVQPKGDDPIINPYSFVARPSLPRGRRLISLIPQME